MYNTLQKLDLVLNPKISHKCHGIWGNILRLPFNIYTKQGIIMKNIHILILLKDKAILKVFYEKYRPYNGSIPLFYLYFTIKS